MLNFYPQLNKFILAVFILFSCHCSVAFSKEHDERFKFRNYTIQNGLSSSSVTCITQDKDGFLWIGTGDGLNRFDGYEFHKYRTNSKDSLSLINNRIYSIYISDAKSMYVGTRGGLNRYLGGDKFQRISFKEDKSDQTDNYVFSIKKSSSGRLWLATSSGLYLYDEKEGVKKHYKHHAGDPNSINDNAVKDVLETEGKLWVVTDKGVDLLDLSSGNIVHYRYDSGILSKFKFNNISTIKMDNRNVVWIGHSGGLMYFNQATDRFEYLRDQKTNAPLITEHVRTITIDRENNLYVGTYIGLCYVPANRKSHTWVVNDPRDENSLSQNSIHSSFLDNANNLWFGTWAGGLNYFNRHTAVFKTYGDKSGLSNPVVGAILEDSKGNLWIGTEGGGLNYFDRNTETFEVFQHQPNKANSLSGNNVQDIKITKNHQLVISTFGKGVNVMNLNKKWQGFTTFHNIEINGQLIPLDWVNALHLSEQDEIYMAVTDIGLLRLDEDRKSGILFLDQNGNNINIRSIHQINNGEIYVGTKYGVGKVNFETSSIDIQPFKEFNARFNSNVLGIYQDEDGAIWVSTEEHGLYQTDQNFNVLNHFDEANGLSNNTVYGVVEDRIGNLWISTHHGLLRWNKQFKIFDFFGRTNGLVANEFNFKSLAKLSTGELFFGGLGGFNLFYPSQVRKSQFSAQVALTKFKINDKVQGIGGESPLQQPLCKTKAITLSYFQAPFSFEFSALDFSQPSQNSYSYQLLGKSKEWLPLGHQRSVSFKGLPAGEYTLNIKATNSDGLWNESPLSVQLEILPAPWLSWWAYLIYFSLTATIIYIIYKSVMEMLANRRALREQQIKNEKQEELNQMKLQFFTNMSHELRTPLTLISGPLEKLLADGNLNSALKSEIENIQKSAETLTKRVDEIINFRKDDLGMLKIRTKKFDFRHFSNEVYLSFKSLAESRSIKYEFISNLNHSDLYFDADKMEIILYNLLSNAFKFVNREHGHISVEVGHYNEQEVFIKISDNGIGIAEAYHDKVFERFFQVEDEFTNVGKGGGIGLALTKRLVDLHYGDIFVESRAGHGATFTVVLKTGKSHLSKEEVCTESIKSIDINNYTSVSEVVKKQNRKVSENAPVLMVVEDNDEIRKFIVSCFDDQYKIVEAQDGQQAWELVQNTIPDIIISDVMMPKMDGIEFCTKLKKDIRCSHIPIVLLTARTSLLYQKNGLEVGVDDYLTKPFTPSLLTTRVKNILQARSRMHQYFVRNEKVKPEEIKMTSKDDDFLKKAIKCVEDNMSNPEFNVEIFMKEIGVSRSLLFRKLKSLTGQSTTEFIRTIRIKRAGQILKQDSLLISETAYEVGFSDLKYFRECFKKFHGMSPSEFVAQHKEQMKEAV